MQKLITLRFPAKCKKCGAAIPAGTRAYWLGKGNGTMHVHCPDNRPVEIDKPKADASESMTFDYSDVVANWRRFRDDPMTVYSHTKNREAGEFLQSLWKDDAHWTGCSLDEMDDWIRNGYRVEGLQGVTSLIPARPRRKLRFSEEGDELHLDLAWAGVDEPFSEWEKRQSKPGLSVEIYMTFSASIPAKIIVAYQRWIARALQTLDENGVDMEVNLIVRTQGADSDNWSKSQAAKIRVRKAGEASDFSSWSAMFSPGGYRMLGIMATGMIVDRTGGDVSYGYGMPQDYGKWDVAYDDERNVIVIGNDNGSTEFPEHEMTEKLSAVLQKLGG